MKLNWYDKENIILTEKAFNNSNSIYQEEVNFTFKLDNVVGFSYEENSGKKLTKEDIEEYVKTGILRHLDFEAIETAMANQYGLDYSRGADFLDTYFDEHGCKDINSDLTKYIKLGLVKMIYVRYESKLFKYAKFDDALIQYIIDKRNYFYEKYGYVASEGEVLTENDLVAFEGDELTENEKLGLLSTLELREEINMLFKETPEIKINRTSNIVELGDHVFHTYPCYYLSSLGDILKELISTCNHTYTSEDIINKKHHYCLCVFNEEHASELHKKLSPHLDNSVQLKYMILDEEFSLYYINEEHDYVGASELGFIFFPPYAREYYDL